MGLAQDCRHSGNFYLPSFKKSVWKQQGLLCINHNGSSSVDIHQILGITKTGVWVDVKNFAILAASGIVESHM